MAALAVLAAGSAFAGDLPSKKAPVPPTFQRATEVESLGYVGVNGGGAVGTDRAYTGGVVAGYNYSQYLAAEYGYEYVRPNRDAFGRDTKHQVGVNLLPKYRLGNTPITVYALGGVGYSFDEKTKNGTTYSFGGGAKYDISKNLELDARIKRVDFFSDAANKAKSEDRISAGLNYKF
jgi:opacity protein-like surface antigen